MNYLIIAIAWLIIGYFIFKKHKFGVQKTKFQEWMFIILALPYALFAVACVYIYDKIT